MCLISLFYLFLHMYKCTCTNLQMYLACLFIPSNKFCRHLNTIHIYIYIYTHIHIDRELWLTLIKKIQTIQKYEVSHKNRQNWLQKEIWNILHKLKKANRDHLLLKGKEKIVAKIKDSHWKETSQEAEVKSSHSTAACASEAFCNSLCNPFCASSSWRSLSLNIALCASSHVYGPQVFAQQHNTSISPI